MSASHVALYLLGFIEQGYRGEGGLHTYGTIEECVVALEAPRLSGEKSGLCPDGANPPSYSCDGGQKVLFLVAKVGAE